MKISIEIKWTCVQHFCNNWISVWVKQEGKMQNITMLLGSNSLLIFFFLLERKISAHPVPTYEYKNTGRHIKEKRFRIRVIPYFWQEKKTHHWITTQQLGDDEWHILMQCIHRYHLYFKTITEQWTPNYFSSISSSQSSIIRAHGPKCWIEILSLLYISFCLSLHTNCRTVSNEWMHWLNR